MGRYTMRQTRVTPNIKMSTKLQGSQRSPELGFRTTDFRVPKNLIFPVLAIITDQSFDLYKEGSNKQDRYYVIIMGVYQILTFVFI